MSQDLNVHGDKPTFNVVIPFEKITIIQMNRKMADILADFINCFDDAEQDILTMAKAMRDPFQWHHKTSGLAFAVDDFGGVVHLKVNENMLRVLIDYISYATGEEREIFALGRALQDPVKCAELRIKKIRSRDDERQDRPFRGSRSDDYQDTKSDNDWSNDGHVRHKRYRSQSDSNE